MKRDPFILKYFALEKELNLLKIRLLELSNRKQRICPHPVWYFLKKENKTFASSLYWTCQCVECNKVVTDKKEFFLQTKVIKKEVSNEIFKSDVPFSQIKEDYKKEKLENDSKVMVLFKDF